jgi:hypothetical protein
MNFTCQPGAIARFLSLPDVYRRRAISMLVITLWPFVFTTVLFSLCGCGSSYSNPFTAPPSNLSYTVPPPLLVGVPAPTLSPTVTGTVSTYTVGTSLPTGLTLNSTTGVISGTPTVVAQSTAYSIIASNSAGSTSFTLTLSVDPSPTVHLSVTASGLAGETLKYQWLTTDGNLQNVNGSAADWVLPPGPGLHFAYVLVSNGNGGYTERRVAVNTDAIGTPTVVPAPLTLVAPPGTTQNGDYYRPLVWSNTTSVNSHNHDVYTPDILVFIQDLTSGTHYPSAGNVVTNLRGEVTIPGVPPGNNYEVMCSPDSGQTFSQCSDAGLPGSSPGMEMLTAASSTYPNTTGILGKSFITGSILLQDGTPCGTANEFFAVQVTATATLLDASGNILDRPARANELGEYALPYNLKAVSVRLNCENAAPLNIAFTNPNVSVPIDLGQTILTGYSAPTVSSMSATFNGTSVGLFLPPPLGLPSDILTRADGFLAEKGLDSRIGACQYYKAVGAVSACDVNGNASGSISFEDWKRSVKIDNYAVAGVSEFTAQYINKMDLNLARVHKSISYAPNQTAAYVCNHLGPAFSLVTAQSDIDTAVDNAVNGRNLVACVAMDYTISPGVNGNQPFIRFLIFGPSGQLLPSVNLDGRREKFVPGTCVVCHGGDHYAGKFPEDGSGFANVGGHFLPYDTGNFEFSSKAGLTEADQEQSIYLLNQNVLNTGPTQAEIELITGWYANGKVLDKNYVPASWQAQSTAAINFYQNVQARSCRSCHVAMVEGYNFDHYQNVAPGNGSNRFEDPGFDMGINVCGGSEQVLRDHMMPNSLVTFNRLWQTYQNTAGLPDQPSLLTQFYGSSTAANGVCTPGIIP